MDTDDDCQIPERETEIQFPHSRVAAGAKFTQLLFGRGGQEMLNLDIYFKYILKN